MRVIRPHLRKKKQFNKLKIGIVLLSLFSLLVSIGVSYFNKSQSTKSSSSNNTNNSIKTNDENTNTPKKIKYFSGDEFKQLYDNIAYPNTQRLTRPPEITAIQSVDDRIRSIAESRGYVLRSVPVSPIEQTNQPNLLGDDLLQQKARFDMVELIEAAQTNNIPLKLNSGYRSIEFQRRLFLERLKLTGVSYDDISAGRADNSVVSVLSQAAIPGYSRHHTGYTVDFVCGNGLQQFETTTCFKWLEKDNYLNAKKYGWIPSYPEGASQQGPEPEPWEYVWVSKQALLE